MLCAIVALGSLKLHFVGYDLVISVSLVIGFVSAEELFRKLSSNLGLFFVHLGNLSYSTYLFHVTALVLVGSYVRDTSRDNDVILIGLVVTITYGMSLISYVFVEQRFRRQLSRFLSNGYSKIVGPAP